MHRRSFLLLPFMASAAHAHSAKLGPIKIGHAWALPGRAGLDGQCFMPLLNTGEEPDALVAARTEACLFVQLRRNARYDDPAEPQFDLPYNKPLAMRPQAVHLRLAGLKQDLKLGERFKLIVDFLNAGEIELDVDIEDAPSD
jgi:periplasmic copper chaperone A